MTTRAAAFNQGQFPTIAFVNLANTPLGVDLDKLVAALAKQLQQDFVPIWGYPAKLYVTQNAKPDEWQVVFLNDADAANALGYHDLTKNGQPISKVFVKTTISAGEKVSVTASHELLEMLIDPGAQLWAQSSDGKFYAYEMCDAVEAAEYLIDGIAVSDFVYPSFFESWHKPGSVAVRSSQAGQPAVPDSEAGLPDRQQRQVVDRDLRLAGQGAPFPPARGAHDASQRISQGRRGAPG